MAFHLRKLSAFLLLLLFLFPTAVKLGHDYVHKDDTHCHATGLHFHQTPHQCAIDDFVPSSDNLPPSNRFVVSPLTFFHFPPAIYDAPHLPYRQAFIIGLRGPPAAA